MLAVGGWSVGYGIQLVMVPYILAIKLQATGTQIGIAQALISLPMLFALITGSLVEHRNRSQVLTRIQLAATVPVVSLILVAYADALSIAVIYGYSAAMGVISMLLLPTRETLVSDFGAGPGMQRWVSATVAMTFGGQIFGVVAAGIVDSIGVAVVLALQFLAFVAAAGASATFPDVHPQPPARTARLAASISDGLKAALVTAHVRTLLLFNFAIGFCFVATFMVCIPVFVRDVLNGDGSTLAFVNASFSTAVALTSIGLMITPTLKNRGWMLFGGLVIGTSVLLIIPEIRSIPAMTITFAVWGIGAANSMGVGRAVLQDSTTPEYRTRHIAIFQSAMFFGSTFGSIIAGVLIDVFSLQEAFRIFAMIMTALMLLMWLAGITRLPDQNPQLHKEQAPV